jgi:hypothetical protein
MREQVCPFNYTGTLFEVWPYVLDSVFPKPRNITHPGLVESGAHPSIVITSFHTSMFYHHILP